MAFRVPKIHVPFVRILNWASIFAFAATRAFLRDNIAGVLADFHFKVANVTVASDEFAVGEDCDVWVTCAIHHFWTFNADAAIQGGEGFVECSHVAADALAFFEHVNFEALISQVKRCIHACDSAADYKRLVGYWDLDGLQRLHQSYFGDCHS